MSYPKYMNDEQLLAFGFAVCPDNPMMAEHKLYPNLSVRYRCPSCNLWASTMKGGIQMVCEQCHKGGRKIQTERQFKKLYKCCTDDSCETWQAALKMLTDLGIQIENCHDGFGAYLDLSVTDDWPTEERLHLHVEINKYSVSKSGARKVECDGTGKLRSQLPR